MSEFGEPVSILSGFTEFAFSMRIFSRPERPLTGVIHTVVIVYATNSISFP
jgi:hypothetical protein